MKLHEYQAKELLRNNGIPVPYGILVENYEEAEDAAKKIYDQTQATTFAVKAQVHAGGRGKAGGIKIAKSTEEAKRFAKEIIGMKLVSPQTGQQGKLVRKVLIEQGIYYEGPNKIKEIYISILLNRKDECYSIVYSSEGGMEIEDVAEKKPELIFKENINPQFGILPFQARKINYNLNSANEINKDLMKLIISLYNTCIRYDATLIEINPLVITSDNKIFAADAKITIDDNSIFRHPELKDYADIYEEDPFEVEASKYNLNFIKLDGNVGCMVNGAGLAMATMDIIKHSGGMPANFLDVGGGANANTIQAGFNIILKDPNVKAILINIFGGIVRCDRVAQGVVEAYKSIGEIKVPVIVRLHGTNAEEAREIIKNSGLKVFSASTLEEAAKLIMDVIK